MSMTDGAAHTYSAEMSFESERLRELLCAEDASARLVFRGKGDGNAGSAESSPPSPTFPAMSSQIPHLIHTEIYREPKSN